MANIKEAIQVYLDSLKERGIALPQEEGNALGAILQIGCGSSTSKL
jgi:predicted RNase H-like HicB family nuclease